MVTIKYYSRGPMRPLWLSMSLQILSLCGLRSGAGVGAPKDLDAQTEFAPVLKDRKTLFGYHMVLTTKERQSGTGDIIRRDTHIWCQTSAQRYDLIGKLEQQRKAYLQDHQAAQSLSDIGFVASLGYLARAKMMDDLLQRKADDGSVQFPHAYYHGQAKGIKAKPMFR